MSSRPAPGGSRRHSSRRPATNVTSMARCAIETTLVGAASLETVPELPEVETIRRHLAPHVEGRVPDRLEIHDARWSLPLAPREVSAAVEGRRVGRLGRRGKYLVWELEDDAHLLLHLRMTGTLLLAPPARPPHTRVTFRLEDTELQFVDPRRFGTGELALGPEALEAFFARRLG